MKPLVQCGDDEIISGLNTFTCVMVDKPAFPSGFSTIRYLLACSEFRSGPVVSLWPGWIVQLIRISLTWRTHCILLGFIFSSRRMARNGSLIKRRLGSTDRANVAAAIAIDVRAEKPNAVDWLGDCRKQNRNNGG